VAGTAKTRRANNAQAKVAALRAEQAARRRRTQLATTAVIAIVAVIAALVTVKLVNGSHTVGGSGTTGSASPAVVKALTSVPLSTYDSVGTGGIPPAFTSLPSGTPALVKDGKPRVLYAGAEYCPFCAAERWALATALSRFGTFTNLGTTASAGGQEYAPNTATLSFHGATYTSKYLVFNGYELQSNKVVGNAYTILDTPPAADEVVIQKYDGPPYLTKNGAIPFIDYGGKVVSQGTAYDPLLLQGMTRLQIAQAMSDPTSKAGKAIIGTANLITAQLCKLTGNQPGNVCTSAGVTAAANALG
jgi:hypothetical protein